MFCPIKRVFFLENNFCHVPCLTTSKSSFAWKKHKFFDVFTLRPKINFLEKKNFSFRQEKIFLVDWNFSENFLVSDPAQKKNKNKYFDFRWLQVQVPVPVHSCVHVHVPGTYLLIIPPLRSTLWAFSMSDHGTWTS